MNTDDSDRPPPSFAQYLSGRRIPATAWGDFIRARLKNGTFPEVGSWAELRAVVETCRDFDISTGDARASWSAFQTMLRDARPKQDNGAAERYDDLARKLGLDNPGNE